MIYGGNPGKPNLKMQTVGSIDERLNILEGLVRDGVRDPLIRQEVVQLVSGLPTADKHRGAGLEIARVFWYVKANVRYTADIAGIDTYQSPRRTIQFRGGDCFPEGTLLFRDDYTFVPVEHVRAGDRIWGRNDWSTVEAWWNKGVLPYTALRLNNGSWLHLTEDHKVYVARCPGHETQNVRAAAGAITSGGKSVKACCCLMDEREIVRIQVSEVRPTDVLIHPDRIAFGSGVEDPDQVHLDGLFLADGWHDDGGKRHLGPYWACISGKDGYPKEAQKQWVKGLCERMGWAYRWDERYIAINEREVAARMACLGGHAPDKCARTLDLNEGAAAALLRGIMADSGACGREGRSTTFTTTSRRLAQQVRVLHKMFGVSCGYSYVPDHGGLGTHPVHRLTPRMPSSERRDGKANKLLRVVEIVRDIGTSPCYDISTSDHYVYLPEADVTVSNCDDHTTLLCTMLSHLGFQTGFRVISTDGNSWEHIYALCGWPRNNPTSVIPLDTTVEGKYPGWEATLGSNGKKKDRYPLRLA